MRNRSKAVLGITVLFFLALSMNQGALLRDPNAVNVKVTDPYGNTFQDKGVMNDKVTVVYFAHTQKTVDLKAVLNGWSPDCWFACSGIHYTFHTHNKVTDVGIKFVQDQIYGQQDGSASTEISFIALTTDAGAPAFTDTTCASEISTNGLQRADGVQVIGTPSAGTVSTTITNTFTASGTFTAVQKACFFTTLVGGTLFSDTAFSSTNMISGDTLKITETVTITYS